MQLLMDIFCFLCYNSLEVIILTIQEIRQYQNNFEVWHSAYKNMTFLAHQHTEVELIRVRSGTSNITVNNQEFSLSEGDLLLCQSGSIHFSDSLGAKNVLEFMLFNPSLVQSRAAPLQLTTQHYTAEKLAKCGMLYATEKLFSEISLELNQKNPFYEKVVQNTLKTYLYKLQRYFPVASSDAMLSVKNSPFISEALSYMEAHLSDELTLEEVSASVNIESGYFSRVFKKYIGLNFVKYRNLLRIDTAIKMLQETDKSISDIAFDCGFQNIRTFNRVFAQYTQKSPMEFRNDPELVCPVNLHPHKKSSVSIEVIGDSPVVKLDN